MSRSLIVAVWNSQLLRCLLDALRRQRMHQSQVMVSLIVSLLALAPLHAKADAADLKALEVALNSVVVTHPRLSPDGSWVAFQRQTVDIDRNTYYEVRATSLSSRVGTSYKTDATERGLAVATGLSGRSVNGMIALEYFDRDPVTLDARELTADRDYRRFGGPDLRSNSAYPANAYALPGNGNLPGVSSRSAGVPAGTTGVGLTPAAFQPTVGTLNKFTDTAFATFVSETERLGLLSSLSYELNERTDLFAELLLSRTRSMNAIAPDQLTGGAAGAFRVPASNPFNPFGVDVGVDYRFVELGPRRFNALNNHGEFSNFGNGYDPQRADLRGRLFYVSLQADFR